jgi:hypothetical protein
VATDAGEPLDCIGVLALGRLRQSERRNPALQFAVKLGFVQQRFRTYVFLHVALHRSRSLSSATKTLTGIGSLREPGEGKKASYPDISGAEIALTSRIFSDIAEISVYGGSGKIQDCGANASSQE